MLSEVAFFPSGDEFRRRVAVGTLVAQCPPHRSEHAELPHSALASGNDEKVNETVYFPYPLKRTVHTCPALCPECVLLKQISFGQLPSLHPLRSPLTSLVRRLPRYYGVVRLPMTAHHRLTSSDFPMRPPFPCEQRQSWDLPIPVQGVSVRAWVLRPRRVCALLALSMRTVLPSATSTASAPWNKNHFTAQ